MDRLSSYLERIDIGGWAMLLSGLMLIGLTYLTPTYLANQSLARQRDHLRDACDRVEHCLNRYNQFVQACQAGDALLVQRLAWHQLHLKPVGAVPLDDRLPGEPGTTLSLTQLIGTDTDQPVDSPATIATLPDTRLTRLTTGRQRYGLLAIGAGLCLGGLLMSLRPDLRSDDN